jgi:hypothetical protein
VEQDLIEVACVRDSYPLVPAKAATQRIDSDANTLRLDTRLRGNEQK